jgi:hypothetical protein
MTASDDLVGEVDAIETLCSNQSASGALNRVAVLERALSQRAIAVESLTILFERLREAIYSGHSARMVSAAADLRCALAEYLDARGSAGRD